MQNMKLKILEKAFFVKAFQLKFHEDQKTDHVVQNHKFLLIYQTYPTLQ